MRELEKIIIIRCSDIDSIVKYDFGNNKFETMDYLDDNVCNGVYKLYENIGMESIYKKRDENFKKFMDDMGKFLQTNDKNVFSDYIVNIVEWILECLVYNKCLMPGNYLIDVSW